MLSQGNGSESLVQTLTELDSLTSIDSVIQPGQPFFVTVQKRGRTVGTWRVFESDRKAEKASPIASGKGYQKLMAALDSLNQKVPVSDNISVLCSMRTDAAKTWDGKTTSHWANLEPGTPFILSDDGHPAFEMVHLELSEEEHQNMMETRLAFYNNQTGVCYPIKKVAVDSLTSVMDTDAAFRYIGDVPLGVAITLSEILCNKPKIQFVCRNCTGNIRPVIGMSGPQYRPIPQTPFVEAVLRELGKTTFYRVGKWSVSDVMTSVVIHLAQIQSDCDLWLGVETSDIPGSSAKVTLNATLFGRQVAIEKATVYHDRRYSVETDPARMVRQCLKAMERFTELMERLQGQTIDFRHEMTKEIRKCIGKKRSDSLGLIHIQQGERDFMELLEDIMEHSYCKLQSKQAADLARCYYEFIRDCDVSLRPVTATLPLEMDESEDGSFMWPGFNAKQDDEESDEDTPMDTPVNYGSQVKIDPANVDEPYELITMSELGLMD
jgi:hypothetical protein